MRIVLDTNILVSGLRSRNGLSYQLISRLTSLPTELCLSVPLVLEYEAVLKRPKLAPFKPKQIDIILDTLCANAVHININYLWRPFLKDSKDDMVLELAVNASASIITYNLKDFEASETLGVNTLTPEDLFRLLLKKGWTP